MSITYIRYIKNQLKDELEEEFQRLIRTKSLKQFRKDELIFILTHLNIDFWSTDTKSDLMSLVPRDIIRNQLLNKILE